MSQNFTFATSNDNQYLEILNMSSAKNKLTDWVNTYTDDLYRWAHHKVSDQELAKDLVQETFLAAAQKIESFKGDSSPKTWLFSILNFKIIDHYRAKVKQPIRIENNNISNFFGLDGEWKPGKRPSDWHLNELNLLDDDEFRKVLKKCMDSLPETWNICVKLKYLMNKSGEEICQELELSPSNYWQIVHRAKLNLRECIDVNWFKN